MSLYYVDTSKSGLLAINPSQIEIIYLNQTDYSYPFPNKGKPLIEHIISVRVRFSSGNEISIQEYKCNDPEEVDSLLKKANEYISCLVESINNFEVKLLHPDDVFRRIQELGGNSDEHN